MANPWGVHKMLFQSDTKSKKSQTKPKKHRGIGSEQFEFSGTAIAGQKLKRKNNEM